MARTPPAIVDKPKSEVDWDDEVAPREPSSPTEMEVVEDEAREGNPPKQVHLVPADHAGTREEL